MTFETILYEIDSHVATITLNRPDRKNMVSRTMTAEIAEALKAANIDDNVRVIVFTGAGSSFSAGADLEEGGVDSFQAKDSLADEEASTTRLIEESGGKFVLDLFNSDKPIIGAINGDCIGIGSTMCLPMDIRLAADDARFCFPFTRRGIVQEGASSWFLPRLVGISQALEWCMRANVIPAEEALSTGLVKALYPKDQVLGEAYKIAQDIATNCAPVSVALSRHLVWRTHSAPHPMEALRMESRGVFYRAQSSDVVEGVTSYLERRPAEFKQSPTQDMPDFFPWWEEPEFS